MSVAEIQKLFAYDDWANTRLLQALEGLDAKLLTAAAPSSFSTPLATIAHIASAEWIWLRRWLGESPASAPAWAGAGELASVRDALAQVQRERSSFLSGLSDARLGELVRYRTLSGTEYRHALGDLLRHVANHSTYHRGQAATQLRQLGLTPPATDLIVYLREIG